MAKERIESILVSTAYEIAVAALAPEARPGDEYFEKLIKDSKEPEITIDFEEIDRLRIKGSSTVCRCAGWPKDACLSSFEWGMEGGRRPRKLADCRVRGSGCSLFD